VFSTSSPKDTYTDDPYARLFGRQDMVRSANGSVHANGLGDSYKVAPQGAHDAGEKIQALHRLASSASIAALVSPSLQSSSPTIGTPKTPMTTAHKDANGLGPSPPVISEAVRMAAMRMALLGRGSSPSSMTSTAVAPASAPTSLNRPLVYPLQHAHTHARALHQHAQLTQAHLAQAHLTQLALKQLAQTQTHAQQQLPHPPSAHMHHPSMNHANGYHLMNGHHASAHHGSLHHASSLSLLPPSAAVGGSSHSAHAHHAQLMSMGNHHMYGQAHGANGNMHQPRPSQHPGVNAPAPATTTNGHNHHHAYHHSIPYQHLRMMAHSQLVGSHNGHPSLNGSHARNHPAHDMMMNLQDMQHMRTAFDPALLNGAASALESHNGGTHPANRYAGVKRSSNGDDGRDPDIDAHDIVFNDEPNKKKAKGPPAGTCLYVQLR
jgi:hypothetical protein